MPIKKKIKLNEKLNTKYKKAIEIWFFSISNPNSSANDENVVKPPSSPEIRKYLKLSELGQYVNSSLIIPIKKQPSIFINKIWKGILNIVKGTILPNVTLKMAPKAPPNPIKM